MKLQRIQNSLTFNAKPSSIIKEGEKDLLDAFVAKIGAIQDESFESHTWDFVTESSEADLTPGIRSVNNEGVFGSLVKAFKGFFKKT